MKQFIEEKLEATVRELNNWRVASVKPIDNVQICYSDNPSLEFAKHADFTDYSKPYMVSHKHTYCWLRCEFDATDITDSLDQYFCLNMATFVPETMLKRSGLNYFEGQRTIMQNGEHFLRPQALVYLNGTLTQAIDINHQSVRLNKNNHYEMYMFLYTDNFDHPYPIEISLKTVDIATENAYYDFLSVLESIEMVLKDDPDYNNYLHQINEALNLIDFRRRNDAYYQSLVLSTEYLRKNYFERFGGKLKHTVNCIGHSHIDMAWLWDLSQTHQKAQRTFTTVLKLMDEYPEYKFIHTSPQLFDYVKHDNPQLFARIKEAVASDRFEVEGSMWVEPDCNLTSGESLVRQILYGKEFFKKEFGVDCKILFLPDVFGYAYQIPQILQKSGITKFSTTKIGWNDTNRFPMDAFRWVGLDGSSVFTYLISTCTPNPRAGINDVDHTSYNGNINAPEIVGAWNRFQSKDFSDVVFTTYGYGDGGGGPTRSMLEKQRRYAYGLPGLGKTKTAGLTETLEEIEQKFDNSCKEKGFVPEWKNELYLEYHRGTYTSVPWIKYKNRKTEFLMLNTELASVLNMVYAGANYPHVEIKNNYKLMLLNQFHDILPGSSIQKVYEDAANDYLKIESSANPIIQSSLANVCLTGTIVGSCNTESSPDKTSYIAFNPNCFRQNMPVCVDGKCHVVKDMPSFGFKTVSSSPHEDEIYIDIDTRTIDNDYFSIKFDECGNICFLFDKKHQRQIVAKEATLNRFVAYEDIPYQWDNWEVSPHYNQKSYLVDSVADFQVIDEGDRKGFVIKRKYLLSTIEQKVFVYNGLDRIDFVNNVDWNEKRQLLKVHFLVDVDVKQARFDVQFGSIGRNTVAQDSYDEAKFEVCAQKWVDMSDGDFGVALMNDCKYGHSVNGNDLAMTVLKSGSYPYPDASDNIPEFTFSLYAHDGSFSDSDIVQKAYALNRPAILVNDAYADICPNQTTVESKSFVEFDQDGVIVETVKKALNENAIILRGFEAQGKAVRLELKVNIPYNVAWVCDLLENNIRKLHVSKGKISLDLKPFEIFTIKIKPKNRGNDGNWLANLLGWYKNI